MRLSLLLAASALLLGSPACAPQYTDESFGAPRGMGGAGTGGSGNQGGDTGNAPCESAGLDCGDHGTCSVASGEPECICNEGYAGENCDECAARYQDNDGDGSCRPSCASNDCSDAGTCSDSSGVASCSCEGLRAGELCERCTAGYELEGDSCEWVGGIVQNGSFNDDSVWTLTGSAVISQAGKFGQLPPDALCHGGGISQELEMPSRAAAEPLLLRFKAWRSGSEFNGSMAVRFGDTIRSVVLASSPPSAANNEFCVGPGSLGGSRTLSFQPGAFPTSCNFDMLYVDDVEIVRDEANVCATEPGIQNGDFTDGSVWQIGSAGVTISGGSASFVAASQCAAGNLTVSQPLMIPAVDQMPGAALRVTYQTGNGNGGSTCSDPSSCADRVYLEAFEAGSVIEFANLQSLTTTTSTACIPPQWRGASVPFRVRVGRAGCASVYSFNSRVDSVELVDEPGCAIRNGVMDGDAESPAVATIPWNFFAPANSVFTKLQDEEEAFEGERYLRFGVGGRCTSPQVTTAIVTPSASSNGKAAALFQYNLPTPTQELDVHVCSEIGCEVLNPSSGWREGVLCLDPFALGPGLPNFIQFRVTAPASGGSCSDTFAFQGLSIDNIRTGTHPSCE